MKNSLFGYKPMLLAGMTLIAAGVVITNIQLENPATGIILIAIGGGLFLISMLQKKKADK